MSILFLNNFAQFFFHNYKTLYFLGNLWYNYIYFLERRRAMWFVIWAAKCVILFAVVIPAILWIFNIFVYAPFRWLFSKIWKYKIPIAVVILLLAWLRII